MPNSFLPFGIGIVIGGIVLFFIIQYTSKKNAAKSKKEAVDDAVTIVEAEKAYRFQELLEQQVLVENLSPKDISEWFKENKNSFDNNVKMIVAIPTDEIIKGLQYSVTEPLDKDKNILQWFYDAETGKVLKIRLIHFLSIDTNLQSLLLENEGMIVIKE